MQYSHEFDADTSLTVGLSVRSLLLTADPDDPLQHRMPGISGPVDLLGEYYTALSAVIDDPQGYGLFVIQCDGLGGLDMGEHAVRTLAAAGLRLPVVLISRDQPQHDFPQEPGQPVRLRGPVSAIGLRVGLEHALRDRLLWLAA